jgi:hypothetical protein
MQFETHPKQFEDALFWPIIKTVWEPFSLKRSHWWHWINYDQIPNNLLSIQPDEDAKPRHAGIRYNLIQTNFGWKKVAVLKPKKYSGKYQCGFVSQEGSKYKTQLCTVILQGPVAVLLSPYGFNFFAKSYPENNLLDLELIQVTTKYGLDKNIPII